MRNAPDLGRNCCSGLLPNAGCSPRSVKMSGLERENANAPSPWPSRLTTGTPWWLRTGSASESAAAAPRDRRLELRRSVRGAAPPLTAASTTFADRLDGSWAPWRMAP